MSADPNPCLCMAQARENKVPDLSPCGFLLVMRGPFRLMAPANPRMLDVDRNGLTLGIGAGLGLTYSARTGSQSSGVTRVSCAIRQNSEQERSPSPSGSRTTFLPVRVGIVPCASTLDGYGKRTPLPQPLPLNTVCLGFTSLIGASTILQAAIKPLRTSTAGTASVKNTHKWYPFERDLSTHEGMSSCQSKVCTLVAWMRDSSSPSSQSTQPQ